MTDVSPILFRIFVTWLYRGSLVYVPPNGRTADEDLESLKITEADLEQTSNDQSGLYDGPNNHEMDSNNSDNDRSDDSTDISTSGTVMPDPCSTSSDDSEYQEEDPTTWPPDALIKLYVFADRFDIRELRADALDALIVGAKGVRGVWHLIDVRYIYMNTPADSMLRKYIVHHAAYCWNFDKPASDYENFPAEFLAAVMVTNSRRLPGKLCDTCHKKATAASKPLGTDVCEEEDAAPFDRDLCFYHEHSDEDER